MRASRPLRLFIGVFDTLVAAAMAAYGSAFSFVFVRRAELNFHVTTAWAAAGAAALATVAIALDLAVVAWIALGYLLWAALLAGHVFSFVFLALAVSLAPALPRPGHSLARGVLVALLTAVVITVVRATSL